MAAARKPKPPAGGAKKATSRAASISRAKNRRMGAAIDEGFYQASKQRTITTRDNGRSPIYGLDAKKKKATVRPPQATPKQWLKAKKAKRK